MIGALTARLFTALELVYDFALVYGTLRSVFHMAANLNTVV